MKEPINLKDRNGKEIHEGDIVRFVVSYDYSACPKPTYDTEDGTVCTDTVRLIDGEAVFCCPDTGGGAYAWRHNKHCEVVGSIYDNNEIGQSEK
jgi:uncharacterized phage protein (TIGR01671 family)